MTIIAHFVILVVVTAIGIYRYRRTPTDEIAKREDHSKRLSRFFGPYVESEEFDVINGVNFGGKKIPVTPYAPPVKAYKKKAKKRKKTPAEQAEEARIIQTIIQINTLKDGGATTKAACRMYKVSTSTFYKWRKKYSDELKAIQNPKQKRTKTTRKSVKLVKVKFGDWSRRLNLRLRRRVDGDQ